MRAAKLPPDNALELAPVFSYTPIMSIFPTLDHYLEQMTSYQASDMYITHGCPAGLRLTDRILPVGDILKDEQIYTFIHEILNEEQIDEFESALELNKSIRWRDESRFRINLFHQQEHPGIVIRRINTVIPSLESLGLPKVYADQVMQTRGLVLVVGQTGSGKSTSLAAMIGYRNRYGTGHVVTIEDPIEFVHQHHGCIITQRDVGIDTYSYGIALKNALRQRPDVVLIGEIRDRETMEQAITFSETGHLCLATLHANNANQTIERILNFFPEEKHAQVRLNLALNLRAILSQRLVLNTRGGRSLAVEIMLNSGLVKSLIEDGKIKEIKEMIERGGDQGMRSFDQSLFQLLHNGEISEEVAIAEADNAANMRLNIKQRETIGKLSGRGISPAKKPIQDDNDSCHINRDAFDL